MIGDRIKVNAIIKPNKDDKIQFIHYGIHPKHKHMFGVGDNEPIYEVEFEVDEEYCKYPSEAYKVDYYCYCRDHDWRIEGSETVVFEREKPEYSLFESNVILFTIQFPHPVFEHQSEQYGHVCHLKLIDYKLLKE